MPFHYKEYRTVERVETENIHVKQNLFIKIVSSIYAVTHQRTTAVAGRNISHCVIKANSFSKAYITAS